MTTVITCPQCGVGLKYNSQKNPSGRRRPCPKCGGPVTLGVADPASPKVTSPGDLAVDAITQAPSEPAKPEPHPAGLPPDPQVSAAAGPPLVSPAAIAPTASASAPDNARKGSTQSLSPYVWLTLAATVVLGMGTLLMFALCAGVGLLLFRSAGNPDNRSADSKAAPTTLTAPPATYETPVYPVYSVPLDLGSNDVVADYSSDQIAAPSSVSVPETVPSTPSYLDESYSAEYEEDPDWQFNLPQYQRDAIRDLQSQP